VERCSAAIQQLGRFIVDHYLWCMFSHSDCLTVRDVILSGTRWGVELVAKRIYFLGIMTSLVGLQAPELRFIGPGRMLPTWHKIKGTKRRLRCLEGWEIG